MVSYSPLGAASYAVAINRSDDVRGLFYRIKAEDGDDVPIDRSVEEPVDSPTSRKPARSGSKQQVDRLA